MAFEKPDYKSTLNLPRTDFPIRPQPAIEDQQLLDEWQSKQLYNKVADCNTTAPRFTIHDGPPYANGPIHLGHAYNKISKDILAKAHRMMGYHVSIRPGWDCHGLPIEIKVTTDNPGLLSDSVALMKECRAYAHKWIDVQKDAFKKLGVFMNWDNPYITMDPSYQASIIESFGFLAADGYIERKLKTVTWCYSCKTTLATAEIEYQDRVDPSVYVGFRITNSSVLQALIPEITSYKCIDIAVWTTTPWTLPLNRAVMIHPDHQYAIVTLNDGLLIVGAQTLESLAAKMKHSLPLLYTISGSALVGLMVQHPFIADLVVPVIGDMSVGVTEGTAAVHVAPGCGPIDYEIGVKQGLDIFCPVNEAGCYINGIVPHQLEGLAVYEVQGKIITLLQESGRLLHKESIKHSYPHCWRCRQGLIFRATAQWFIDLHHNDVQARALQAIDSIAFVPENARNFLRATIAHRWEWCISRQRVWGVPIPALLCQDCDRALLPKSLIDFVIQEVRVAGVEFWQVISIDALREYIPVTDPCRDHRLVKEMDILDVWFDSGVSHQAVLKRDNIYPADIYLEGVDQHRGWFQSSLLTSIALSNSACMKGIVSHGYTVDEKGRKMSKSIGNVISPDEIVEKIGTDGLRLWVASMSLEGDLVVSSGVLQNVSQVYRKIRNTARFLLQNLYDFDPSIDQVRPENLLPLDAYAYAHGLAFGKQVIDLYKQSDTAAVYHALSEYCTHDLSATYLDMIKDRLYTAGATSHERRSAQTVVYVIAQQLIRLMAPILSFTAEWLHKAMPGNVSNSIHELHFLSTLESLEYQQQAWKHLFALRDAVLQALERIRERSIIAASLQARVVLYIDTRAYAPYQIIHGFLQDAFLAEFFIVSQVVVIAEDGIAPSIENTPAIECIQSLPGVFITAEHARGDKCYRCWQWHEGISQRQLCARCEQIVN